MTAPIPTGKPAPATGLRHLLRSCGYTANGLREACREAAFRQELALGVIVLPLSWLLSFSPLVSLFLDSLWVFLLVTELLNTAIEAIVDLASPGYHELAKRSKDLASAAVGLAIAANLFAWLIACIFLRNPSITP
jgi:diacylglycerol kinase (ATP)